MSAIAPSAMRRSGVDRCQSAAWANVEKADLLPGVKMALSAMDAHAILQHQGYSLNPF